MPTVRRLRVSNPHKRKSRNSRRRARRNPGEVLIVANPKKSRRRNRRRTSAKRNPSRSPKMRGFRRRGHRRSNPSGGALGVRTNDLLTLSLGAGAGMLGSKALAQLVLGGNNSGLMGLGATAIAGGVIAFAAKKFVGKEAAVGVIAGTGGAIALALWQQYVSGTGTGAMSGLGDPDMAGVLGEYRAGIIPMPSGFNALPAPAPPQKTRGRG